jgi:hypothetical protein
MNLKPASGSAASSSAALSDTAETSSKSAVQLGSMQKILIETFKTSAHLLMREKVTDLRLTYAKYLAIQKMIKDVGTMERAGTWTHPKPTVQEIAEVFMSRSGYFNRPRQLFPKVDQVPEMKKWLEGDKDALPQSDVWGDKKPTFKSLKEILDSHTSSGKKKKVAKVKGKQPLPNSEVVVKGKGKEKAEAKNAGEGSKRKGGSRKTRRNVD